MGKTNNRKRLVDGWYTTPPTPEETEEDRIENIRKNKESNKPVDDAVGSAMMWKLASKLTDLAMAEAFGYSRSDKVVSSVEQAQKFALCGKIFDVMCEHKFEIRPSYARYWLPYNGAPVYRIAGGDGERLFVERCEFNLFDQTFTNVLALGRMIFLDKGEAYAALDVIAGAEGANDGQETQQRGFPD